MKKDALQPKHNPGRMRRYGMLGLATETAAVIAIIGTVATGISKAEDGKAQVAAFVGVVAEAGVAVSVAAISVKVMDEELRRKRADSIALELEQTSKPSLPTEPKDIR